MRTPTFGVLLVLGSIGALSVNGVAGCTYTAAGQGADAAPPSIENGDGGAYVGGEDGGVTPQPGADAAVPTGQCGEGNDCNGGVCCGSTCCGAGSSCCNGNECCGSPPVTCGADQQLCGSNGTLCCPMNECCGDIC